MKLNTFLSFIHMEFYIETMNENLQLKNHADCDMFMLNYDDDMKIYPSC